MKKFLLLVCFSFLMIGCTDNKVLLIPNDFNISDVNFFAIFQDFNLTFPDVNNANYLSGVPGSGYIRTNGSSTTTASVPFAKGITMFDNQHTWFNDSLGNHMYTMFFNTGARTWTVKGRDPSPTPSGMELMVQSASENSSATGANLNLIAGSGADSDSINGSNGGNITLQGGAGGSGSPDGNGGIIKIGVDYATISNHDLVNRNDLLVGGSLEIQNHLYGLDAQFSSTIIRADGNITMTSPNGTIGNCGMGNDKVFRCS